MKRGAPDHPKIKHLARLLGIGRAQAVGHFELLLHWTTRYAVAGDIGKYSDAEIAESCFWDDEPAKFIGALLEARLLDANPACRLLVHDWPDHSDDSVHMALARAVQLFADGTIPKLTRLSQGERKEIEPQLRALKSAQETHTVRTNGARRAHKKRTALPSPPKPSQALPSQAGGEPAVRTACAQEPDPPPLSESDPPEPDPEAQLAPAEPSDFMLQALRGIFPKINGATLRHTARSCLAYYRARGEKRVDWTAQVEAWIAKDLAESSAPRAAGRSP